MRLIFLIAIVATVGMVGYWIYENIFRGQILPFAAVLLLVTLGIIYYKAVVEQ